MDYQDEQRLRATVHNATQLVEAMTRRHAEQDQKTAILTARIERLEKILKVEIQSAEKDMVNGQPKKGILDRVLGR